MKTIDAATFGEQFLSLVDEIDSEGLIITRNGKPVARLLGIERNHEALIGSLRDRVEVKGNIQSTGIEWNYDSRS